MIGIIAFSLLVIAIVLFVPVGVLFVECVAALLPTCADRILELPQPKLAVLVPAHDEAAGIKATLTSLLPQLVEGDRLVVIADNCTDATAEIAREVGATVIERQDTNRRGKGYALDYGLRYLEETNPPDVVAIVDADCRVEPGTLGAIARLSLATKRPVQSVYLLESPPQPSPKDTVSALAFSIKNLVRMRGMTQLGLPCLLAGTGMAFPWQAIRQVSL
ncbi:MAG: glycosyltransferase, partial [Coleofasciculaceae cyanobacterium SM2_3_26]|nr:glycosyltransferase [Coleofasciculaceae cyanobacterium SM2_3_26]